MKCARAHASGVLKEDLIFGSGVLGSNTSVDFYLKVSIRVLEKSQTGLNVGKGNKSFKSMMKQQLRFF